MTFQVAEDLKRWFKLLALDDRNHARKMLDAIEAWLETRDIAVAEYEIADCAPSLPLDLAGAGCLLSSDRIPGLPRFAARRADLRGFGVTVMPTPVETLRSLIRESRAAVDESTSNSTPARLVNQPAFSRA